MGEAFVNSDDNDLGLCIHNIPPTERCMECWPDEGEDVDWVKLDREADDEGPLQDTGAEHA
jgi:hypothetical protein